MKPTDLIAGVWLALAGAAMGASEGTPGPGVWTDASGDASVRRIDPGNDAPLPPAFSPIDLLSVRLRGWTSPTPASDPYNGSEVASMADLFRIDITLDGLVNPPGPVGSNGFNFEPQRHGDRPFFGFIDMDLDDDPDTGGELHPLSLYRYLANVGRFGMVPVGPTADRIVRQAGDADDSFSSGPQFERTGAEFSMVFCGCEALTILIEDGDFDQYFDPGETWIVRGRMFERFQSFVDASGLFGGSDAGLFDPTVEVRFAHDLLWDKTTVTMVFPITMAGASLLTGEPEQPLDFSLLNHTALFEALDDLILSIPFAQGELLELVEGWSFAELSDYRKPQSWRVTALIGSATTQKQPGPPFVWTDTGFGEVFGDLDGDGVATGFDARLIEQAIECDWNDGSDDGRVQLANFGPEFDLRDLNGDGVIGLIDRALLLCPADMTVPYGVLDFFDASRFLTLYNQQSQLADLQDDDVVNFFDVVEFFESYNSCQ